MIYTVISTLGENRIEEIKRDCRIARQPLSLLQGEIAEYVNGAKNEDSRAERRLAYSTLLLALNKFFGIDDPKIVRNEHGKPYIEECGVYFSISHSDGAAAVVISDEGECGIDLQHEISPERAERLQRRFFTDLTVKSENIGGKYYFCRPADDEAELCEITLPSADDSFTAKWTLAESLMKMHGRGFADASAVGELVSKAKSEIKAIGDYTLALSVRK